MCANRGSGVRCQGSEVQGLRGSKVQRFKGSRVQRFKGSEVQRFKGLGESDEYRISPRLNNETERFNGVKITNLEPKIIRPKPRKKAWQSFCQQWSVVNGLQSEDMQGRPFGGSLLFFDSTFCTSSESAGLVPHPLDEIASALCASQ